MQSTVIDADFGTVSKEQMSMNRTTLSGYVTVLLSMIFFAAAAILLIIYLSESMEPKKLLNLLYILYVLFIFQMTFRYLSKMPKTSWKYFIIPAYVAIIMLWPLSDTFCTVYFQ